MTAANRLAEIQTRADNATDGPWESAKVYPDGPCDIVQIGPDEHGQTWALKEIAERVESVADAEFLTAARTDVPALVAALRAVLDRHRPLRLYEHEDLCHDGTDDHIEERHRAWEYGEYFCLDLPTDYVYCAECRNDDGEQLDYPCPTVRAVEAALGEAS